MLTNADLDLRYQEAGSVGPWPPSPRFLLARRPWTGLSPAGPGAGRSPHGAPARPAEEDVPRITGDVISLPGVPHGPPGPRAKLLRML